MRRQRPLGAGRFEHVVQALEQLPSVRQIRERIVLGKVPQLQRAFLDAMFEVCLVGLDRALSVSQLAGHVIERVGEFVELAGAAAHHASCQVTRGQAAGPGGQSADGPGDRPRGRGQREQRQQDRLEGRGPDRLLGFRDGPWAPAAAAVNARHAGASTLSRMWTASASPSAAKVACRASMSAPSRRACRRSLTARLKSSVCMASQLPPGETANSARWLSIVWRKRDSLPLGPALKLPPRVSSLNTS